MLEKTLYIGPDNIRGLIQDVAEYSDALAVEIRGKTIFADITAADARTFMLISRHPRGITELAKAQNISRQAAHKSLKRLINKGVASLEFVEGSRRDKIAKLTDKGLEARKVGLEIASAVEACFRQQIGYDDLETLRRILLKILSTSPSHTK